MHSQNDIDQLIIKYLDNSLSVEEKFRLQNWINSTETNKLLFEQLTQPKFLAEELSRLQVYDEDKGWSHIRSYILQERDIAPKRYFIRWTAAAAAVVLIFTGYFLWQGRRAWKDNRVAVRQTAASTSQAKSKVVLPDGSVVILNKRSEIRYNADFGVSKREIVLNGEAYFDVVTNKNVPLTVVAGSLRIKELGTAFNVRAYGDDTVIETSLIRGAVEVSSADDPERSVIMHPNEKIAWHKRLADVMPTAHPGPRNTPAEFPAIDKIRPNPTDSSINELVWLQDKLSFSHEPFYSLAQKMEGWYRVKIVFMDETSGQLFLTGSLKKENLVEALDALSHVTPFEYSIQERVVTIHKKAKNITHQNPGNE